MPTLVNVSCFNCHKSIITTLKRFNEYNKEHSVFYCSMICQKLHKTKAVIVACANLTCENEVPKQRSELGEANYCSRKCAAIINNSKRRKNYNLNNSYKALVTYNKNPHLNVNYEYLARKDTEVYKVEVINGIKEFYKINDRIPVKREMGNLYRKARKVFGTWNNAIKGSGFNSNPVMFAKKYLAKDGHRCDSFAEMIIDNWLYSKNISHQIHVLYPKQNRFRTDFLVGGVYIEFLGLLGQLEKYDELVKRKLSLIKGEGLDLVKIYPKDLFPNDRLDSVLKSLL